MPHNLRSSHVVPQCACTVLYRMYHIIYIYRDAFWNDHFLVWRGQFGEQTLPNLHRCSRYLLPEISMGTYDRALKKKRQWKTRLVSQAVTVLHPLHQPSFNKVQKCIWPHMCSSGEALPLTRCCPKFHASPRWPVSRNGGRFGGRPPRLGEWMVYKWFIPKAS